MFEIDGLLKEIRFFETVGGFVEEFAAGIEDDVGVFDGVVVELADGFGVDRMVLGTGVVFVGNLVDHARFTHFSDKLGGGRDRDPEYWGGQSISLG